ncbi:uridine kinase family protein [Stackebrandtia soli]|uniref:uridine kinase family protein n=1 Tax=Stackebrandtia soli TaxID=1892856 RepID=UPI0039EC226B
MRIESYATVVSAIVERPPRLGATRLVAVDGRSGSGKSTFARRLAERVSAAGHVVAIVHTDDLLIGWEHPLEVGPRLSSAVLGPISRGEAARFRAYDWERGEMADDFVSVDPPDILIMEGVSSARREWNPLLTFNVFIYADANAALGRVLDRDGMDVRDRMTVWQSQEDGYFADDDPRSRADRVVDGVSSLPPDAVDGMVLLG